MKVRYSQTGVFTEPQDVSADSKGLSPFLAFWRSAITPSRDSIDGKGGKAAAWMAVDVSPARPTIRRHPILEFLSSAFETLATHPSVGFEPVQAHYYWLPEEIAALRTPLRSLKDKADTRQSGAEPLVLRRVRHLRLSFSTHRFQRRVGATRKDN